MAQARLPRQSGAGGSTTSIHSERELQSYPTLDAALARISPYLRRRINVHSPPTSGRGLITRPGWIRSARLTLGRTKLAVMTGGSLRGDGQPIGGECMAQVVLIPQPPLRLQRFERHWVGRAEGTIPRRLNLGSSSIVRLPARTDTLRPIGSVRDCLRAVPYSAGSAFHDSS